MTHAPIDDVQTDVPPVPADATNAKKGRQRRQAPKAANVTLATSATAVRQDTAANGGSCVQIETTFEGDQSSRPPEPNAPKPVQLAEEVRRYIPELNACFVRPSVVVDRVRQEFGVEVTRQHVETYDPTKISGLHLRPKYKMYFESARLEYEKRIKSIGVAQQVFRLDELDEMYHVMRSRNNYKMAMTILDQAARETALVDKTPKPARPTSEELVEKIWPQTSEEREARIAELREKANARATLVGDVAREVAEKYGDEGSWEMDIATAPNDGDR